MMAGSAGQNAALRRKIYTREVSGRLTRLRHACVWLTQAVWYGLPWLTWNGRPAVLFDLPARHFYVFGLVLPPQDLIYLAVLLVLCAGLLFLLSAIAGRVWCGLACPHSVYSEIFAWIARATEGKRSARIRLDRQPASLDKIARKGAKHAAWIAVSLWTGITLVAYFTPMRTLLAEIAGMAIGPWQAFWILAYGGLAYLNAGWLREQICQHVCAYARFQSVMFDRDTLLITYDESRGEPRGIRRSWRRGAGQALGDCIDCGVCVQACPAGIDIRDGLQYACIDCGACVDACNGVMEKTGMAPGLIRYASGHGSVMGASLPLVRRAILRPRVLLYAGALVAGTTLLAISLALRQPLRLNVMLDRSAMGREAEEGMVENVYRLQVMNADERAHRYRLSVSGPSLPQLASGDVVEVDALQARPVAVRIRVPAGAGGPGADSVRITLTSLGEPRLSVTETAPVYLPRGASPVAGP